MRNQFKSQQKYLKNKTMDLLQSHFKNNHSRKRKKKFKKKKYYNNGYLKKGKLIETYRRIINNFNLLI